MFTFIYHGALGYWQKFTDLDVASHGVLEATMSSLVEHPLWAMHCSKGHCSWLQETHSLMGEADMFPGLERGLGPEEGGAHMRMGGNHRRMWW